MYEQPSLSHVRRECKSHVVITPKSRQKVFLGKMRRQIGTILRDLCRQRGVELLEGHAMADHIHTVLSVPPKFSVAIRVTVGSFSRLSNAEELEATILRMTEEGRTDRQIAAHLTAAGYRSPKSRTLLRTTVVSVRLVPSGSAENR